MTAKFAIHISTRKGPTFQHSRKTTYEQNDGFQSSQVYQEVYKYISLTTLRAF